MHDVAVALVNAEGQVLANGQLVLWDQPVVALPIVRDEGLAAQADLVEQAAADCIITRTQNSGHNALAMNVIEPPDPQLGGLFEDSDLKPHA